MHLITFRVTFVQFCPILGHFGRELFGRRWKFAVAKTGKEGHLCSSRLGKRFVRKFN